MGVLLSPITVREVEHPAPYMRVDEIAGDPRRGMRATFEVFPSQESADDPNVTPLFVFLLQTPWEPEPLAAAYARIAGASGRAALANSGLPADLVKAITEGVQA